MLLLDFLGVELLLESALHRVEVDDIGILHG